MPVKPQTVDQYLVIGCGRCEKGGTPDCKVLPWVDVLHALRAILTESVLTEEIKWSAPCYTFKGKNILTLSALKDCAVISFFRGGELQDPGRLLDKPGPNSRFARYIKITDVNTIPALKRPILAFIEEAITLEVSGKPSPPRNEVKQEYPEELIQALDENPGFAEAFHGLTPGRQRGYLIHFNAAKQSTTRIKRIEKSMAKIFAGKGWNER